MGLEMVNASTEERIPIQEVIWRFQEIEKAGGKEVWGVSGCRVMNNIFVYINMFMYYYHPNDIMTILLYIHI